jgi:hypothetical protein
VSVKIPLSNEKVPLEWQERKEKSEGNKQKPKLYQYIYINIL